MKQQTIKLEDSERQRCEVWTRVMGYHRPVSSFNPGKQSEHAERVAFIEPSLNGMRKRQCCQ
jgi:Oxygen-sensitive ribonucleoside-triphosphate reductase